MIMLLMKIVNRMHNPQLQHQHWTTTISNTTCLRLETYVKFASASDFFPPLNLFWSKTCWDHEMSETTERNGYIATIHI